VLPSNVCWLHIVTVILIDAIPDICDLKCTHINEDTTTTLCIFANKQQKILVENKFEKLKKSLFNLELVLDIGLRVEEANYMVSK
jgi:hypothetical protein